MDLTAKSTEELEQLLVEYETKAVQEDLQQLTMKLQINSLYGALGSEHFCLYNPDIAEAITSIGRYNIKSIANHITGAINNKFGEKSCDIVVIDTDSNYYSFAKLLDNLQIPKERRVDFLDQFAVKVLNKLISEKAMETAAYHNDVTLSYNMDREAIAKCAIVTGKKRYAAQVLDNEGRRFAEPYIKITGLEIKRSSTPNIMRTKLLDAVLEVFDEDNKSILKFIKKFEQEYKSGKYTLDQIAIPTGVSDVDKYAGIPKGTPINARASIVHNRLIEKYGLDDYQPISNGDKIKFLYLKEPNRIKSNVIAFNDVDVVEELGLLDYVDYNTMWEKTFIKPLSTILHSIGWSLNYSAVHSKGLF